MTQQQILISQALEALNSLKQDKRIWECLNVLIEAGSEINLEDAIVNLETASLYLGIDPNLRNINPDGLPADSWPAQLQRDLDIYALNSVLEIEHEPV